MDIRQAQKELRSGMTPSPDYPDLPNDYTAAELIAFDPKAELEYRMVKDRQPDMTRAKLMQHWRSFRIGSFRIRGEGAAAEHSAAALFRRAAERFRKKPDPHGRTDEDAEEGSE